MGLTSALFTGLSGLDVNQQSLNVIGNNIANANTTAFKASMLIATPQFYVTDSGGTAPTETFGGTNPSQTGLGVQVATIEKDFTPGSLQATGKDTDLAINGNGFFVVNGANGPLYTRDGSFSLNSQNQLVTTAGQLVQGYGVDSSFDIVPGALQNVTIPVGASSTAQATQNVSLTGNLDAGGVIATGASILNTDALTTLGGAGAPDGTTLLTNIAASTDNATPLFTAGQTFTLNGVKGSSDLAPQTFTVSGTSTLQDLENFFQTGLQINTTIAPPTPGGPTPGASLVADPTDPNSVFLTITGNTGTANALTLGTGAFTSSGGVSPLTFGAGTDANGNTSDPNGESITTTAQVYDSLGNPINVNVTAVYQGSSSTGTTWQFYATSPNSTDPTGNDIVGSGTLSFDSSGNLLGSQGTTINIDRAGSGAKSPLAINLDFSGMTALASQTSNLVVANQDGSALGSLTSFSIGTDGVITGSFSNGLTRSLGQVALATFNNNDGLIDEGSNLYSSSANSGAAIVTTPDNLGAGTIQSGALELSNVDLSTEFTNLIIASTGFSASSRVITTSDQLITDLLNSNR